MAERYTKKDAEKALVRLCDVMGKRVASSYDDVGGWMLDHNSIYGGYVVHEVYNQAGAVSEPFGSTRRNARDFWQMVWDITKALEIKGG